MYFSHIQNLKYTSNKIKIIFLVEDSAIYYQRKSSIVEIELFEYNFKSKMKNIIISGFFRTEIL